ncbi:hypothetical protein [Streptococcus constellatus]
MFYFLFNFLLLLILWYALILFWNYFKRRADFYNGKVVQTSNLWAYSFQILLDQINVVWKVIKFLFNKWQAYSENKNLQQRKTVALNNTKNHINENLEKDIGLKYTKSATTGGVDLWVYLSNDLSDAEKLRLENYFSGVLSKYTAEFALDILIIELTVKEGWVAKFDIKPIAEATYNRMARSSEIINEDKYDEEEIDLW